MKISVNKFINDLKHPQGCFQKTEVTEKTALLNENQQQIDPTWGVNTKMWVRATLVASTLQ